MQYFTDERNTLPSDSNKFTDKLSSCRKMRDKLHISHVGLHFTDPRKYIGTGKQCTQLAVTIKMVAAVADSECGDHQHHRLYSTYIVAWW
jgi:hypothetical protein